MDKLKQNKTMKDEFLNIYVSNLIDEAPKVPGEKAIGKQRNGTYEDPFA